MRRRLEGLPKRRLGRVDVALAATRGARLRGLAGRDVHPDSSLGLLLPATRSIHTFGMAFPLDLVWLDRSGDPIRLDRTVPPRRFRTCVRARAVIELASGGREAPLERLSVGYAPDGAPPGGTPLSLGGFGKWQRSSASQAQERSRRDWQ